MSISGIYIIRNNEVGDFYLGSAKDIEVRFDQHRHALQNKKHENRYFQFAWDKYGENNFEFLIIEEYASISKESLLAVEQIYLNYIFIDHAANLIAYNLSKVAGGGDKISYHVDRDKIVEKITNSTRERYKRMSSEEKKRDHARPGSLNGMYGKTHTPEACDAISTKLKIFYEVNESYRSGKTLEELFGKDKATELKAGLSAMASARTGDKNPFYGKKHSPEICRKISEEHMGKYLGDQNKIVVINNKTYRSVGEASKELGIPAITLRWRVLSKNSKFENYQYYGNYVHKTHTPIRKLSPKAKAIIIDDKEYPSAGVAVKALNITRGEIEGRVKSKNFPNFRFKDETLNKHKLK